MKIFTAYAKHQGRMASGRPLILDGQRPSFLVNQRNQAFVLLEVVLALALFGMVATSLTTAINQIAIASNYARQESRVLRAMESALAQVSHQLELKPGAVAFPPNSEGVAANAIIEKAEMETKGKAKMDHMFRIIVNAWMIDGRQKVMKRQIETYIYAPNSPVA